MGSDGGLWLVGKPWHVHRNGSAHGRKPNFNKLRHGFLLFTTRNKVTRWWIIIERKIQGVGIDPREQGGPSGRRHSPKICRDSVAGVKNVCY